MFVVAASSGLLRTVSNSLAWAVHLERTRSAVIGVVTIPVAWLLFSLEYTGHDGYPAPIRLLLIEPAVFVTLVWSNHAHELIWSGRGTQYVSASSVTLVPVVRSRVLGTCPTYCCYPRRQFPPVADAVPVEPGVSGSGTRADSLISFGLSSILFIA